MVLILERLHRALLILVRGIESVRIVVPLVKEVNHSNAVATRLILTGGCSLAHDVVVPTMMYTLNSSRALCTGRHLVEMVHEAASVRILLLNELLDVTLALSTLAVAL